jgi:hypothetical protein
LGGEDMSVSAMVLLLLPISVVLFFADLVISIAILDKSDPLFYRVATVRKRWNKIYQCNSCKKLSREYQRKIYNEVNSDENCPHCERCMFSYDTKKIKEEGWMNSHPDCPRINFLGCVEINKTIKKIRENKKMIKSQQFFEEYNKIEVDFNWIENLQKKYK